MNMKQHTLSKDEAETVALRAVAWIMGEDDRRDRFIALTGLVPESLQNMLDDHSFLSAALDFLMGYEPDLLAFCTEAELDPQLPQVARQTIGNNEPHWT